MSFRVDIEIFRGPLDLLLYLVRKHEVDVADIPMVQIIDQFLEYLGVLEKLDVNGVGDFLEAASTLIEIKSRMLLPSCGEEGDELCDPREELVERLLEYKKYKDAASILEERSRAWQQRVGRLGDELQEHQGAPGDRPIHEVELWDLVGAFGRIMRDRDATRPSSIVYDETPIGVYLERIHRRLVSRGRAAFSEMFSPGIHKSAMIGVFLAILELVRHQCVRAEQTSPLGEIWIIPAENFDASLSLTNVNEYECAQPAQADRPDRPR
jgi:segregation and condensation protein A